MCYSDLMYLKIYTAILYLDDKFHLFYLALKLSDFSILLTFDAAKIMVLIY